MRKRFIAINIVVSYLDSCDRHIERFQAKWTPVRVKKTRQIKNLEPRFDSIETEKALDCDIARLDTLDAGLGHIGPGLGERALGVDAAAGVFDHIRFKAGLARVDRRPRDAE